jgi:prolyl oligopeptidase
MSRISRRRLFAGAAGTLAAWLARRAAAEAITMKSNPGIAPAPVARVAIVKDTYFGEVLSDPYRWMENDKDAEWLPFLKGQNEHARAVLERIPGRAQLLQRIQQLSGDAAATTHVQRAGGRLFYQQRPAGADNFKLFVREAGGATRVLIDPTLRSSASSHQSLDWWHASPEGTRVVYGLSRDGSEDSVLHILTVADARDLPETIPNTESANPSWLADGSGFFYNQLTGAVDTPERYLDSVARLHRLGTEPTSDPIVMKRGLDPRIAFERIQMPNVEVFEDSRYVLLALSDVREESRLYVAPLADVVANSAHWVEVARFEDEITDALLEGDTLYLLANKDHPRGRLLRTSAAAPSLSGATEVLPESRQVLQHLARARDGLYLQMMDGGVSRLRCLRAGGAEEIALPFDGTLTALATTADEDGALFSFTGWLTPADIWSASRAGKVAPTGLNPPPPIDVSAYESARFMVTVRDGTQVPCSLIYRKGLKRDGSAPAWISAYGSYGLPGYTPAFAGRNLALIDAGFIVGYAHVRGGGEYGRAWHKAGQLTNKPNTWRDLIDVCEALCAQRYTARERLAIGGRSAGGITVGRSLTERPELFAAVIDGVGWSNPLRYVAEQNGYGEEPEWGAIAEEAGYRALRSIDSYQAVKDGVAYPAVLLTTGVTDPRVAPFHVAKMAARLQAASRSHKPILLRVDFDAGHGVGSTRTQQDREAADTYAFLLWQTGVKGYQPA